MLTQDCITKVCEISKKKQVFFFAKLTHPLLHELAKQNIISQPPAPSRFKAEITIVKVLYIMKIKEQKMTILLFIDGLNVNIKQVKCKP